MKILGVLLVLGALIVGGLVLFGAVPAYRDSRTRLTWAQGEATKAQADLEAIATNPAARERSLDVALRDADQATFVLRIAQESVERRRDEAVTYGGAAAGGLALGVVLFLLGRRKKRTPAPQLAAA